MPRAAVILGNDAVVAARPCSAWQLAHACRAAGFDIVVPPTVGDELVAGTYLERLARCGDRAVVACHCPRARMLLARCGSEGRVPPIRVVAPPIAAARALRLTYGDSILVTYVGDCPAAHDASINAHFSPSGFLASLERQRIAVHAEPDVMAPADAAPWHRYLSVPGGLPALRWLARAPVSRVLRDVGPADVDASRWTTSRSKVLLDLTEHAACACGGARSVIEECEPPRASAAIVVAPPGLELSDDFPVGAEPLHAKVEREPQAAPAAPSNRPVATLGNRATKVPPVRTALAGQPGSVAVNAPTPRQPQSQRDAGSPAETQASVRAAPTVGHHAAAPLARTGPAPRERTRRHSFTLLLIPLVVLTAATALGAGVYAFASRGAHSATASGASPVHGDTISSHAAAPAQTVRPRDSATASPATSAETTAPAASIYPDTTLAPLKVADSAATASRAKPKAARRRPRIEVVPGWLPQGRPTFAPVDTSRATRKDSSASARPKRDTIPRT